MKNLEIYRASEKIFPENFDIEHYMGILFQYPENKWFAPDNSQNEGYSVCEQLGAMHIIAMRRIPCWVDGLFRGVKTECFYNKDLNYETLSR